MFRSPKRSTTAAVLLTVGLLFTSACGVDNEASGPSGVRTGPVDDSQEANDLSEGAALEAGSFEGTGGAVYLSKAAEATQAVETQRMTMVMSMDGIPGMGSMSFTVDGAIDTPNELAHMTMEMGELTELMGMDGTIEMIIDGETTYMKAEMFSMLGGDDPKPWIRMDDGESAEEMFGTGSNDPGDFLAFLENAGGEVTEVGNEEIRGVETKHVTVDLDLVAMMEDASEDERAEMEEALEELGASGGTIPTEAWIDGDGYVRKLRMAFDFDEMGASDPEMSGVSMTIDIEMYDFNEPLDIEVPDPSDVGEMPAGFDFDN